MTGCTPSSTTFPQATTFAAQAATSPIVWAEISALQQAILSTAGGCSCSGSRPIWFLLWTVLHQ